VRRELTLVAGLLRKDSGLVLLNVVGNAMLILASLAWLWIPDSHVWQFVISAVSGPAIVFLAIWLQVVTMARWNRGVPYGSPRLLRHLPGFVVWLLAAWGVCLLVGMLSDRQYLYAGYLASRPSQHLRYWVTYPRLLWLIGFAANAVTYYVLPALMLPLASETAAFGLRGIRWRRYLDVLTNWGFWLVQLLLMLIGVWLPMLLLGWTPGKKLGTQILSIGLRLFCAYLLAIGAWIVAAAFVGVLLSDDRQDVGPAKPTSDQSPPGVLTEAS
jgi:hypothetical protein